MTGVVLCGGLSRRMGRDKGLMVSGKRAWAEIIREKFPQRVTPAVLSINAGQRERYLSNFRDKDLVVDNAALKMQGPLRGLLSVHLRYPNHDLLAVACDMIDMSPFVLEKLLKEYAASKVRAIAFKGDRIEPMCAIYSSQGLAGILSSYHHNDPADHSMMQALEELDAAYISIPAEWK
ncbi:MAG TPA: molybdenum cofactor guanylyltransferase, partial [Cyclobacteriaceae bacterium]|nr:molybdenum cofactor guanylyltransferase [Cyclobacteriaceae bacterium]